jgi:DNA primase
LRITKKGKEMYSQDDIARIKDSTNIEEVVGKFVALKRSGGSYKGLSPFTQEKTPSFFVLPSKGIYKCFSSGKAGDVFSFLMEHERMNFNEAVEYVANLTGEALKKDVMYSSHDQDARNTVLSINSAANKVFTSMLTEEHSSVLIDRGFTKDCLEDFGIGFCPQDLEKRMVVYNPQRLIEASILKKGERGNYPFFFNRITFPIKDAMGNIIGFGARAMGDAKPKYLNTAETVLYVKSKILYGIFESKEHIRKANKAYLVEGYTDVMAMHQGGLKNVVSASGTSFTEQQAKEVKRYCDNVTVIFDGDAAGKEATLRGIKNLLKAGLNVNACILEDGKDPCDYALSGHTAKMVEIEKDFIKYLVSLRLKAGSSVSDKTSIIHLAIDLIGCINDDIKRAVYAGEVSTLLDIPKEVLMGNMPPVITVKDSLEYIPYLGSLIEAEATLVSCVVRYGKLNIPIAGGCSVLEYILFECQDAAGKLSEELDMLKAIVLEGRFPTDDEYFDILHRNMVTEDTFTFVGAYDADKVLKEVSEAIWGYKRFLLSVLLKKNLKMIEAYSDHQHLVDNAYLNKIKKILNA